MTAGTSRVSRRAWEGRRLVPAVCAVLLAAASLAVPSAASASPGRAPALAALRAESTPAPSLPPTTNDGPWVVPPWPDVPADTPPTIATLVPGDVGVLTYQGTAAVLIRVRDVVFHDTVAGLTNRISGGQFVELTIDVHLLRPADPTVPGVFWNMENAYLLRDATDWPTPAFPADQAFIATSDLSGKVGYEVYGAGLVSMTWTGPDGSEFTYLLRPEDYRLPTGARTTGWPVGVSMVVDSVAFGPDGTVYMTRTGTYDDWFHQQELVALDAHGRLRPGWTVPVSTDWGAWPSIAVAGDGTVYLASRNRIDAFGSDGKELRGWPVVIPRIWLAPPPFEAPDNPLTILPVASGGVDVVAWGPDDTDVLLSVARDATLRRGWPRVIRGLDIRDSASPFVAFGDVLTLTSLRHDEHGDVVEITAYGLDGRVRAGWPTRRWDDVVMAPDGRLVAWKNASDFVGGAWRDTITYAVLGRDGRPTSGWPRTMDGYGSRPGFGPGGVIECVVSAGNSAGSRQVLIAFDRSGRTRAGYPASLPSGMAVVPGWSSEGQPAVGHDPLVVAGDGTTYVYGYLAGRAVITAYAADGRPLPGWPYRLPAGRTFAPANPLSSYSPAMPMATGSDGRVYVATVSIVPKDLLGHGQILAIGRTGDRLRGWPQALPDVGVPLAIRPTATGGITVAAFGWLTLRLWVTSFDPSGRLAT